jgi:SAM-dependent methyltransferase
VQPEPPTGHWHDDYEHGRPGWPVEVVTVGGMPPSAAVVELGAGTGKLTRLLVERFDQVVAVEPADGMLALLRQTCPDADIRPGSAEAIPVKTGSVDAVYAAESFHWFDGARAIPEIDRVLRPPGILVLMWNVPGGPAEPSTAAAERLLEDAAPPREELGYDPVDLNATRFSSGAWREPFAGSRFERPREVRIANPQMLERAALLAFYESMGWFGELSERRRAELLEQVRALLKADRYRQSWVTRLFWTRLRRETATSSQ